MDCECLLIIREKINKTFVDIIQNEFDEELLKNKDKSKLIDKIETMKLFTIGGIVENLFDFCVVN